jgi:hypothetical protein
VEALCRELYDVKDKDVSKFTVSNGERQERNEEKQERGRMNIQKEMISVGMQKEFAASS